MSIFTPEQEEALLNVRNLLEGSVRFVLFAGTAAAQHGYAKTVNDIDILLTKEDLKRAHKILLPLGPSKLTKHEKPGEYWGFRVDLPGASMELCADIAFEINGEKVYYSADDDMFEHAHKIMLKERDFIPVTSPEDTLVFYAVRQNPEKDDLGRINAIMKRKHIEWHLVRKRLEKMGQAAFDRASAVLPL